MDPGAAPIAWVMALGCFIAAALVSTVAGDEDQLVRFGIGGIVAFVGVLFVLLALVAQ